MTVTVPGYSTLTGNPETILMILSEARCFEGPTGDAYIDSVVEIAMLSYNITLNVRGSTYAERAESLLREMAKNHMIQIED